MINMGEDINTDLEAVCANVTKITDELEYVLCIFLHYLPSYCLVLLCVMFIFVGEAKYFSPYIC
jgi:hypothetical protein